MDSVGRNKMGYEPIMPYLKQVRELKSREELLKRLAAEYTLLGKECEQEHMKDAAIRNYQKALELYPEAPEAKRRLKKLQKK